MKMQAVLVLVSIWGGLGVMASDFDLSGQLGNAGYIRAASTNLQAFTGALGGLAPPITKSSDNSRPFEVQGSTFPDFATAAQRSCSIQHNTCADAANAGGSFKVSACDAQQTACDTAQTTATNQSFGSGSGSGTNSASGTFTTSNAEFDFICEN